MSKKSNKVVSAVLAASLALSATSAFAYRPLVGEDAYSIGKGKAQIEVAGEYAKAKTGEKGYGLLFVPTFGAADKLELSAEIPMEYLDGKDANHGGLGDINFTAKYEVLKGTEFTPDVALKANLKTYTGNEDLGLGTGKLEGGLTAVASKSFGPVSANASVGYTLTDGKGEANDYLTYGASLDYKVNKKLDAVASISGEKFVNDSAAAEPASFLVGAAYKVQENLAVNAGYKQHLNNAAPDYGFTVGATYNF